MRTDVGYQRLGLDMRAGVWGVGGHTQGVWKLGAHAEARQQPLGCLRPKLGRSSQHEAHHGAQRGGSGVALLVRGERAGARGGAGGVVL